MTPVRALLMAALPPGEALHVARWAWAEGRRLPRALRREGIEATAMVRPAPATAARHRPVAAAVLRLSRATCLVRSAVLQRWDLDHGRARPLVVGVARNSDGGIAAHAWLDGEPDGAGFIELHRRPPV